jgi:two-component system response regulator NreC
MLRILIADDHRLLRAGLRSLLRDEPDLEVVGEAADGDETLVQSARLRPDIVLADISMPGPSGIEVARQLRHTQPSTRVLILTMHAGCYRKPSVLEPTGSSSSGPPKLN